MKQLAYYEGKLCGFKDYFKDNRAFLKVMKEHSVRSEKAQQNAWLESYECISGLFEELSSRGLGEITYFIEYALPEIGQRIDLMIAGKGDSKPCALVFELKGHKNPDITEKEDAIEQLTGYLSDLRGFCSAAETFEFKGLLWFYNVESEAVVDYKDQDIVIFYGKNYKKLTEKILEFIKEPVVDEILKELREARYTQRRLFEFIKNHGKELYEHGMSILRGIGFYPKSEQREIINSVLKSFEEKQKKCFFIKGEPGSGKTYIAFMLLLEVLSKVLCPIINPISSRTSPTSPTHHPPT